MSGYLQLLRYNPGFARLWLAQVISLLGDWFGFIVLAALVAQFSKDTPYEGLAITGFLLARMVPPLVVSPFAGVLVDRFDRKRLLIMSDVLRSVVVLLLLLANEPNRLWLIYVLVIFQFALSAVFEPGRNAIVPSLLKSEELVQANTLSSVTWSVMLAIGAIIGGIIASLMGTAAALVIDASTFLVSAVLIIQISPRADLASIQDPGLSAYSNRTFREGLRYLRRFPATLAAITVKGAMSIGAIDAVTIVYSTQVFVRGEGGTTSMAILWSAFGIGAILGPIVLNRFSDGTVRVLRRLVIIGFLWGVVGWLFLGIAPSLEIAVIALIVRAMGGSVNWTYSSVIIQKSVPDEYLGRMFSLDFAGFNFMQALSAFVMGLLIDAVGSGNIQQIVIWTGFANIIPTALWALTVFRLEKGEVVPVPVGD